MISQKKSLKDIITGAAADKKAQNIVVMDMEKLTTATDYFIVCSATSVTQAKAIADNIDDVLRQQGIPFRNKEGYREGRWILLDYNECVVHIFVEEERQFYNLEGLWGEAPRTNVEE